MQIIVGGIIKNSSRIKYGFTKQVIPYNIMFMIARCEMTGIMFVLRNLREGIT